MFTFCLFMFWLHTVVLSKTRKLEHTNRVNLSVFTVHLAETLDTSLQSFTLFFKKNSSRHNNITAFEIRYYNANSVQRRYPIRHWIPMFFGTPCIIMGTCELHTQFGHDWFSRFDVYWIHTNRQAKFIYRWNKNVYIFLKLLRLETFVISSNYCLNQITCNLILDVTVSIRCESIFINCDIY